MPLFKRRWAQPSQRRRLPFSKVAAGPITGSGSPTEGDDQMLRPVGFYSPLLFVAAVNPLPGITGTANINEGTRIYGSAAIIEDA